MKNKFEIGDTVFTMADNEVFKGEVVKVVDVENKKLRVIKYNLDDGESSIRDVPHHRVYKELPDLKYHLFKNFKTG